MAQNPRVTAADLTITWDGVQTFVPRGTVVDVPAGSALETAYGVSNLVSLTGSMLSDTEPLGDAGGGSQ
jgi:hypothetical protein